MKNIVGVRFKKPGKIYFFDSCNFKIEKGDFVIVETVQGQEYGEVITPNRELPEEKISIPLKPVLRIANEDDKKKNEENRKKEEKAKQTCEEQIKKHKLDMNLTDVEYKFDNSKIIFYYTADGRIDFRELVKDLAAIFKNRIEMRQIGVRDEIKKIGGNGICGRELCCCSFLENFETVSIKMAKEQNISLNPAKIAGNCGRLMCCLKYEEEVYSDKIKKMPKVGAIVETEDGTGEVCNIEILAEQVKVRLSEDNDVFYKKYNAKDVKIIKEPEAEKIGEELSKEELAELEKLSKEEGGE